MKKHMRYSRFSASMKRATRNLRDERGLRIPFEDVANKAYSHFCKNRGDRDLLLAEIYAGFLWEFRKIDHYFLDPGMAEFLISSIKEIHPDYCKAFPDCKSVDLPPVTSTWAMKGLVCYDDNTLFGGFAIHFPQSEQRRSMIVVPGFMIKSAELDRTAIVHKFAIVDGVDILLESNKVFGSGDYDESQTQMLKLVMGLSLYLDAFPDYCKEIRGCFAGIKDSGGVKKIVKSNSDAGEFSSRKHSPHWRRGHFRLLVSEKFKKKQGMTIFVKGSFVSGKAYLVTDQEA